ncbi:MAG: N-acetyltransferase [Saprospiraceae bacterium]|nr:N-acetyltransferase [Saprospiraceae bacterium]
METSIRPEQPSDIPAIHEVNHLAFGQAEEAVLVDNLRNSDAFIPGLSLVAVKEGQIVGHILFTKIKIKDDQGNAYNSLALAPMAVRPEFQNKGIGGQLIRSGLDQAKALGHASVIVLGHEHYYPRFGFVPAEKWNIRAPFEVPSAAFMGIELQEDALGNVRGIVEYDKAFEGV